MKASHDLFELIQSMSKSEKGYFKKFCERHVLHGENNYIKLFDAIEAQQEYNEEAIKKQFKKETFVKQLTVTKNYLARQITKALGSYYSENDSVIKLRGLLNTVEIFQKKSLLNSTKKGLLKAKRIAYMFEQHETLLEILRLEKNMLFSATETTEIEQNILKISNEEKKIISQLLNINEYQNLYAGIFLLSRRKGNPRNQYELVEYQKIIQHPLLKTEKQALSREANILYNNIHLQYEFVATKNFRRSYTYSRKILTLLETDKEYANIYIRQVIHNLRLHLILCENLSLVKEREAVLNRIKNIEKEYPSASDKNIQIEIFDTVTMFETQYVTKTSSYEKGEVVVNYFEENINKYANTIPLYKLTMRYYTVSIICFVLKKYSACLKWINKILAESEKEVGTPLYSSVRILQMITHYEMGNIDLLSYMIKSVYRYHYQKERLLSFERIFFNFFNKNIIKSKHPLSSIDSFQKLKAELETIQGKAEENIPFFFFDYVAWAESKIEKKEIIKIFKRKKVEM